MQATNQELDGHWLLGSVADFRDDPLAFMAALANSGHPVTKFNLGPRQFFFISEPDLMHEIMVKRRDVFARGGTIQKILRRTMGDGILVSDGKPWLRQRRMMQPAFHMRQIANYADIMVAHSLEFVEQLQHGEMVDMRTAMNRLTLGIVTEAMFDSDGTQYADVVGDLIDALQESAIAEVRSPIGLPEWVPTPGRRLNNERSQRLRDIIQGIVDARRVDSDAEHKHDLLTMLLAARDEDTGEGMTDNEIIDEVITIFLAGYDTTSLALSWSLYCLAQEPQVREKLLAEVDSVLGGRVPTLEDLPHLTYTEMVFKETLRRYPSAYFQTRYVHQDTELGGMFMPQGSTVMMSPYGMHHRDDYWDAPYAFRPERFADNADKDWPKFKYMPFGNGPHICIGNRFAMMEGILALATIAQHVVLELPEPDMEIKPAPRITLSIEQMSLRACLRQA